MRNVIESVLAAEKEARSVVEAAQAAAEQDRLAARQEATALLERARQEAQAAATAKREAADAAAEREARARLAAAAERVGHRHLDGAEFTAIVDELVQCLSEDALPSAAPR